ncbi:MAG: DegV family protein [Lachnospiraceae bacterium]|nr:DegV family protein [Lachnospiraceae bacterium]
MVRIYADSTNDLSPEYIKENDIRIIPLYVTMSDRTGKDVVDDVRGYLESLGHFDEIIETRAGGIISCHCGPGTLGVLFIV